MNNLFPPEFKALSDFQAMVDAQVEETLTLEYKASPALARGSKDIEELCKDVSAMANSAGGRIIYGIEEDKKTHKPVRVDEGVRDEKITREWIHQILSSNIQPRIERVRVTRVELSPGGYGFVIDVEPTVNGPHQAPNKKYYKRFELEAKAMDDYEIRDILRRATTPLLEARLSFEAGDYRAVAEFKTKDLSEPFSLRCTVINHSPAPAQYVIVEVWVDDDLESAFALDPFRVTRYENHSMGGQFRVYQRTIATPYHLPVFKEAVHADHVADIPLKLPMKHRNSSQSYFETRIQSPGFTKSEEWFMRCNSGRLHLLKHSGS
ncbi:AlbA family DNA-binding domain-containing protein [Bradyrhizobium sp. HKCCYLS1011]|uniref:AlbA family DNA-binding domain-containing protein n=1 Tax=Bradyrhizobium sp. HKCCYLS1011 TaxID=3420733 RepID=UPI003EBB302D